MFIILYLDAPLTGYLVPHPPVPELTVESPQQSQELIMEILWTPDIRLVSSLDARMRLSNWQDNPPKMIISSDVEKMDFGISEI